MTDELPPLPVWADYPEVAKGVRDYAREAIAPYKAERDKLRKTLRSVLSRCSMSNLMREEITAALGDKP